MTENANEITKNAVNENGSSAPKEKETDNRKVAIIGCGFVGASIAFTLMQRGLFSEMVLIDRDRKRAEGEALDISHGLPYSAPMEIYAGDYDDIADAALIIIAAGANQKPGETRLDLIDKNLALFAQIIPEIKKIRLIFSPTRRSKCRDFHLKGLSDPEPYLIRRG